MATLRDKKKLAALNKDSCEEHLTSNQGQNSSVPRSQEDYITQVSEGIEGRVTKKLSQEFSKTENRVLGALSRLDDFLMNPLIQGTPEPFRRGPGTHLAQTRERMRTTPRVILILKQASSVARQFKTLAQKLATTVSIWRRCELIVELLKFSDLNLTQAMTDFSFRYQLVENFGVLNRYRSLAVSLSLYIACLMLRNANVGGPAGDVVIIAISSGVTRSLDVRILAKKSFARHPIGWISAGVQIMEIN